MAAIPVPDRGEIWLADLNPVRGHQQAGRRPVLILSVRPFNGSKAGLVVVIPITSTLRAIPWHVVVQPPEGGLDNPSALLCEAVRSISNDRLLSRWGSVNAETMAKVEDRMRMLLGL
jgi:mRNA interferase MazF